MSYANMPVKKQRQLSIACVRNELTKGNFVLKAGGIRAHTEELELCIAAFRGWLHVQGYKDYADSLVDSVKHAFASVLKTEGRKSEHKKLAYTNMINNGKARVQRWRLSARMIAALVAEMALQGASAEVRAKKEQVSLLCL
jgi:hypothetical protein